MRINDPLKVRIGDLRPLPLFEGISLLKLRKLTGLCRKRMLPKNTVLFLEDEPATHLYFVLKGSVALTIEVEGHRSTVYDVDDMGSLGLSSLVSPFVYTATAICGQPSLVLDVDSIALRKLMVRDHRLASQVMSTTARLLHTRLAETRRFFTERLALHASMPRIEALVR